MPAFRAQEVVNSGLPNNLRTRDWPFVVRTVARSLCGRGGYDPLILQASK
jgi:hypothetical protein